MNSEIKTVLGELRILPMFKMSLGSKELFHSNFLDFLWSIESRRERFIRLINILLRDSSQKQLDQNIDYVLSREKENFDICLYHQKGKGKIFYDLIIENKVKSIPRKDQLEEYENKVNNKGEARLVLLTLVDYFPCKNEIQNWCIVSYEKLAHSIEETYKGVDASLQIYIDDYCSFVRKLHKLQLQIVNSFDSQYYFNNDELALFRSMRLHDLYIKLRGSLFLSFLAKRLNTCNVHIMPFTYVDKSSRKKRSFKYEDIRDFCSIDSNVHIFLECSIQQGNGMVAAYVYRRRSEDYIYEIAIQNDQYRHGINSVEARGGKTGDRGLQNVWDVVSARDSAFFNHICGKEVSFPIDSYNKYRPEYVYKYVKIDDKRVEELLRIMTDDINNVVNKICSY
jgi:hypothetical protein